MTHATLWKIHAQMDLRQRFAGASGFPSVTNSQ